MWSRKQVGLVVEDRRFQWFITTVIVINAIILGAETTAWAHSDDGYVLQVIDRICLAIFVVEILLKLIATRLRFFRDPWNCFDFIVIAISIIPAAGGLSVLRGLRILRIMRLASVLPSLRRVVSTLFAAIPGMVSILGLLVLILYVAAVMATNLFQGVAPQFFGDLGTSLWSLFQTMTGEGWPEIARTVMKAQPTAWIFFLVYIVVSTFIVLNLFLAVMVSAAERVSADEFAHLQRDNEIERATENEILQELRSLRADFDRLVNANSNLNQPANGERQEESAQSEASEQARESV